ncbi:phosphonate monoester hydrolase [Marinobacterium nitratireducens]|uniref:Phosphonate monoester hydrolase n=1 Tax=Marinobacterium nitratireducens TaxID=518897 RepID=A0A917ZIW5_9GAMM|nr:sulfatase-like hydrolase/transferase [Marinobacterium nitratireducens]GGO83476.1 phosphonate monoester hydrolase [Marinobacterium nitratireducens]
MSVKNILFIMIDQLRWDALSCYGNPVVETPNIDRLARRGVRFTNAFTQGTSCGNSRASIYTGRHVRSHGATWNDWPFPLDEWTLADYLQPLGPKVLLLGKTHMKPDSDGMQRLGIAPDSPAGRLLANAGFTAGEHDDGVHPEGPAGRYTPEITQYDRYLREQGFDGRNPWLEWANAAEGEDGSLRSGFYMENAHRPARIAKEFSETAYMTNRAIETIDAQGENPWCLHLSYIKPHWPFMAPAPYHDLYRGCEMPPPVRSAAELEDPHPLYREYMKLGVSRTLSSLEKRNHVLPTYYGLIRELDDNLGRLFDHLERSGQADNTLIALTADHGDYFGDHWLAEKDLFHNPSVKIPLIIADPSQAADATRGSICDDLTGAIDLLPTFIEALGGSVPDHRLEGQSLRAWLHGDAGAPQRSVIFSEGDYGRLPVAQQLGVDPLMARITMAFDGRYKLVHCLGLPDMLYDLHNDPDELVDLGRDPGYAPIRQQLRDQMLDWSAGLRNRTAVSRERQQALNGLSRRQGVLIGVWSGAEVPEELQPPREVGVR